MSGAFCVVVGEAGIIWHWIGQCRILGLVGESKILQTQIVVRMYSRLSVITIFVKFGTVLAY